MPNPPTADIDSSASLANAAYLKPLVAIMLGASLLAIAFSAWCVIANYRPTLNWDQWGDLSFLINIKSGQFSILDLFAQHNEHRIFTPRLLFLIDALWFDYRNIFLLTVIFIVHLLIGGLAASLWFDRNREPGIRVAACVAGASLLVTIVQYENLLWGFQISFSLVYLFALLALLALGQACLPGRPARRRAFLGLYVALYALSAFSTASGLLLCGAAIVLVGFTRGGRTSIAVVAVSAAALAALYLSNYQTRSAGSVAAGRTIIYAFYLLGSPLTKNLWAGVLLGAAGATLLLVVTLVGIRDALRKRRMPVKPAVLTCFAGFALASAAATGAGRAAALGIEQAASGRYATVALLFWLALGGSAYWFGMERLGFGQTDAGRSASALVLLVALVLGIVRLDSNADTRREMSEWALRIDRASIAIMNNVEMTEGTGLDVLFLPPVIKERAKQLKAYGWNIFSSRTKAYAPPTHLVFGASAGPEPSCRGFVDSVTRLDEQRIALRGWLLAPSTAQSPSWIFVRDELGGIVGYFFALDWRPDLVGKFGTAAGNGYFAGVDFKHPIPPGRLRISLVGVFDGDVEQTCAFPTELDVPGYAIASYYGEPLPARPILGLASETRGTLVPPGRAPAGFPALPVRDGPMYTVGAPSSEGATMTYRFDVSNLGTDDVIIPISAERHYDFLVDIMGPNGPIESVRLNTLSYPVWKIWRFAIVPRARLPGSGEVRVTVRIPDKVPPAGATLGAPFATPANPNRAALY